MRSCEVITQYRPVARRCGKPAVAYYPAMGGGRMLLCYEHVQKHARTPESAKATGLRTVGTDEPYGWRTTQNTPPSDSSVQAEAGE